MAEERSNSEDDDREDLDAADDEREDQDDVEEEAIPRRPNLITVQELLAMGALDVPPSWRTSLSACKPERDLFSDLD